MRQRGRAPHFGVVAVRRLWICDLFDYWKDPNVRVVLCLIDRDVWNVVVSLCGVVDAWNVACKAQRAGTSDVAENDVTVARFREDARGGM